MNILLIDNYDSFTYNLHHIVKSLGHLVDVVENDKLSSVDVTAYDKILISPGPGIPDEAGLLKKFIEENSQQSDMLGVCLGMQAIIEVFGGHIKNLDRVYHGVSTYVEIIQKDNIFKNVQQVFKAGRYHSWAMDTSHPHEQIDILAKDVDDEVMAIKIAGKQVRGVQFHPESILTDAGNLIMENWLHQ